MKKSISGLKKEVEEIRQHMKDLERSKKIYTLHDWTIEEIDDFIVGFYKKIIDENYKHSPELTEKIELTYFGPETDIELKEANQLLFDHITKEISKYIEKGIFTEDEGKRLVDQSVILAQKEWR